MNFRISVDNFLQIDNCCGYIAFNGTNEHFIVLLDGYTFFSYVETINHECIHLLLSEMFDVNTSGLFDDVCDYFNDEFYKL